MTKNNKKINIIVVGCGGIGSYLAQHIDQLIDLGQLPDASFTFFDDDIVEKKNILYQNFEPRDVDSTKVEALEMRYFNLEFINRRCVQSDLKEFDLIVLCADNNKIRRSAWKAWKEWKIPSIDSRANGKVIGIYSSNTENYLETMDKSDESHSCQNPFQIEKHEIEYGNVVVAAALAQTVLTYVRNKKLPNDLLISF